MSEEMAHLSAFLDQFDDQELTQLCNCQEQDSEPFELDQPSRFEKARQTKKPHRPLLLQQESNNGASSSSDTSTFDSLEKQQSHLHLLRKEVDELEHCVRALQHLRQRRRQRLRSRRHQFFSQPFRPTCQYADRHFRHEVQQTGEFESRSDSSGVPGGGLTNVPLSDAFTGDQAFSWRDSVKLGIGKGILDNSDLLLHQVPDRCRSTTDEPAHRIWHEERMNMLQPNQSDELCLSEVAGFHPRHDILHPVVTPTEELYRIQPADMTVLTRDEQLHHQLAMLHDSQQRALDFIHQAES